MLFCVDSKWHGNGDVNQQYPTVTDLDDLAISP